MYRFVYGFYECNCGNRVKLICAENKKYQIYKWTILFLLFFIMTIIFTLWGGIND